MPTTSHPPRRSRSSNGAISQGNPLKSIHLSITLIGAGGGELERLAAEQGLKMEERGRDLSVALAAASPEEALDQLRLLAALLASKA